MKDVLSEDALIIFNFFMWIFLSLYDSQVFSKSSDNFLYTFPFQSLLANASICLAIPTHASSLHCDHLLAFHF